MKLPRVFSVGARSLEYIYKVSTVVLGVHPNAGVLLLQLKVMKGQRNVKLQASFLPPNVLFSFFHSKW